jgi:ABC-type multidrug transport system ATPase subunit
MSEAILNALMQLFALISDIHEDTVITSKGKNVVRLFLLRNLNNELASRYMKMYDDYLDSFNSEKIVKDSLRDRKRTSLNAIRILSICEKINEELEQKQKIYVLVKLMDYISLGEKITENELDFVQTVADSFNISAVEFSNIRSYIMEPSLDSCEKSQLLAIYNNVQEVDNRIRHLFSNNLPGRILFLNIRSTNTYLMRYSGESPVLLNGQEVQDDETYVFEHGSSVRGAGIKAIYYSEIVSQFSLNNINSKIFLEANNVNFTFRRSTNGVHGLSFRGTSGELTGILGGSGVGKSTTLSILSGTLKPKEGTILINGYDLYNEADRNNLRGVIGFVPQDDLLIEDLTVYQNLYYNARMCLSQLPEDKLEDAVEKILADLDLSESRDLRVGNPLSKVISGGQRKRINIALELMREPTILFVDEPTSGLSSVDSEMVMSLLKDLTFKGKLVIVNIHQPSSEIYKMFDKIMIIDRGGYLVFSGNPSEAIVYFRDQVNYANPDEDQCTKCGNVDTEQLLRIIEARVIDEHGKSTRTRKVTPSEWANRFLAFNEMSAPATNSVKTPVPKNFYSIPGLLKQSVVFFLRDLRSKIADRQYLIISLSGPPLLALLLSYFTRSPIGENYVFRSNENLPAYIFMCVITSLFFGIMGSSEEIVSERKILKRESFLNLSWFSYLNSKILIMFILSAIQSFLFVIIGNRILEIRGMTLSYWFILFTTSCFGNMLGLNLSSAFKSLLTIYILIPFIIIPQLLFSGVLVKFDSLNIRQQEYVPIIGDLMIARWSFEAIATDQFKNNKYERLFFPYDARSGDISWNRMLIDILNKDLYNISRNGNEASERSGIYRKVRFYTQTISDSTGIIFPDDLRQALDNNNPDPGLQKSMISLLDSMKSELAVRLRKVEIVRDRVIMAVQKANGPDWLTMTLENNDNAMLRDLMLANDRREKAFETETKIIRKYQPAFMKPYSRTGRAHFYAPVKLLGPYEFDTYWFNAGVVWIISFLLYMVLYFRIPQAIQASFEKIRFKKLSRMMP